MTTPGDSNRSTEYVVYHSRGSCLIVGEGAEIERLLSRINRSSRLSLHILVIDRVPRRLLSQCEVNGYPLIQGRPAKLQGYLGQFQVLLEADGAGSAERLIGTFDLVVDLSQPPLIGKEVVPFGYFVPDEDRQPILDEPDKWIGDFEKPKYFSYQQDLCAHGGSHHQGCRSCIEVCPAQAIVSVAEKRIEINPYLCQGCGDCTAACPSGALNYRTVERQSLLEDLFAGLSRSPGATIVFYPEDGPILDRFCHESWIRRSLPTVAACGPEVWLALVAAGASGIRLQRQGLLSVSRQHLQRQMTWVNELLAGLGYGSHRIAWLEDDHPPVPGKPVATGQMAAMAGKRDVLELALNRLIRQAERQPEWIALPQGAPVGTVEVDQERCTLCFACVASCPSQALQTSDDGFQLRLVEQNCLQCGWCADVCPEDAIGLVPRLLTDSQRRRRPQSLHQEPAFNCPECGKGFANRKIIEAVLAKIAGHPLFADARQRRRLLLCEDCRVRDIMRGYDR